MVKPLRLNECVLTALQAADASDEWFGYKFHRLAQELFTWMFTCMKIYVFLFRRFVRPTPRL